MRVRIPALFKSITARYDVGEVHCAVLRFSLCLYMLIVSTIRRNCITAVST